MFCRFLRYPEKKAASPCDVIKRWGIGVIKDLALTTPQWGSTKEKKQERTVEIMRGNDIPDEKVEWIWHHRFQRNKINSIEGLPGDGKSFIAAAIAAAMSKGLAPYTCLKDEKKVKIERPVVCIYLSIEQDPATSKRRFKAADGDVNRFYAVRGIRNPDGSKSRITLEDIPLIEDAVKQARAQNKNVDIMVWLDPLQSFIPGKVDMHRANETREILDPLAVSAQACEYTVVVLRHVIKSSGSNRAALRGVGSVDIIASIRSMFLIGNAPDDPHNRAMIHAKTNDGPRTTSLRFDLVHGKNGADESVYCQWMGESKLTAADLAATESDGKKSKEAQVADWLEEFLENGPRCLEEIKKSCPLSGGDEKSTLRLLNRGAHKLTIEMEGPKNDPKKRMWKMPDAPKFGTYKPGSSTAHAAVVEEGNGESGMQKGH